MKKFAPKIAALLAIIFSLLALNQAIAQNVDNSENIKNFVKNIGEQIIETAKNKTLNDAKKNQKIIDIIDKSTDTNWIGKFVLGKNYKNASEAQKSSFLALYREFMINTYGPKFKNYDGKKFDVISIEKQNSFYLAKSEFLPKDSDKPISVDYRVKDINGAFFIVDFIAEGVSLIETQRSEFNSIIDESGMDKFLENLKNRVKTLKQNNEKNEHHIK